ncbi:hypothetical protein CLV30_12578 [Haloactinopolyspora alba]|uniref:Uncharacterized protein n=1 Tax=Haloactinopolyspora alba TaxID=648780 RepID=A0A2P8DHK2_9ACTN|nr:DUF6093 family protein [Haloactinopolyspora alba]PSK96696.1 hypothetical protein CLV30_12578 [Haloactinopolyspora alba]
MGTAERVLRRGRRRAEALMIDTCRVRRVTGTVTNPDGTTSTTYNEIYAGACRIQTSDPYESRPEAGEYSFTVVRSVLQVPMSVTGIEVGDIVDVTASQLDPDLIGRVWRVAGPSTKSHQTMRRYFITEVAG